MKMSDNPTKYELLIEQYLRSILDILRRKKTETCKTVNYPKKRSKPGK